ncbi:hypothetical protein [Ciceribacter azotifigens]|uniref:hypothetical protein n=1 Tax=Ciceribacter azotifigens TaxID=2069303 RepID=UPI003A8C207C
MSIPEYASAPDIAALIGVSERRVRQIAAALKIEQQKRGQFPVAKIVRAALHIAGRQREPTALTEARARAHHARADQLELRMAQARRELIPADDFLVVFDFTMRALVDELVAMPARVTRDVPMRRTIEAEVEAIRNRLAALLRRKDAELRGKQMKGDDDADEAA